MALLKYDLVDQIIRVAKTYAEEEKLRLKQIDEDDAAQAAQTSHETPPTKPARARSSH